MKKPIIPIFFACDDNYVKYTIVSLASIIENADKSRVYDVHVLNTNISEEMKAKVRTLENECFTVTFDDVSDYLHSMADKLPVRDYFSKTTYFRFFIAEMFPELQKAIYIDSDTIVTGDISKLYDTDIGDNMAGACHEQVMVQYDVYGTYVERVLGVSRHCFFNAGVMLLNCHQLRVRRALDRFLELLRTYNFVVTQDEDYLNLICKDRVFWLDQRWNTEMEGEIPYPIEEACVLHYIMVHKPWHYADCRHGDIFWCYAEKTCVYEDMKAELAAYTDTQRERDRTSATNLSKLARAEIEREDNYLNVLNRTKRAADRVQILEKIAQYEREGRFTEDVEDDPPSRMLMPNEVDYLRERRTSRIKQAHATRLARKFLNKIVKERQLIVKEIRGIEHWQALEGGAIVTCNHFNPFDTFAMHLVFEAAEKRKKSLYRVIREGNYTSFPGFYGYLMRNFYTLPLSSNRETMKQFVRATRTLLEKGQYVLVYPEQSMWWNYRKPKPLQKGAYSMAARSNVPVLPCFITMQDSDVMGGDGFPVQEYTVHIGAPIYPKADAPYAENVSYMMEENARVWREMYENAYGIVLQ